MFYPTKLDDGTTLLLEAQASDAFAKSDLEVRPDPMKAVINSVELAQTVAQYLNEKMRPVLEETGADADFTFSIRVDGNGTHMLAQDPERGQLRCKLTLKS